MKKAFVTMFAAALFASACTKEDHAVRVKNQFPSRFTEFAVGEAFFSNIESGVTTEYKPIVTGDFKVGGKSADNFIITGSGKVSGAGKHRWTLTVSQAGNVAIEEDK